MCAAELGIPSQNDLHTTVTLKNFSENLSMYVYGSFPTILDKKTAKLWYTRNSRNLPLNHGKIFQNLFKLEFNSAINFTLRFFFLKV